MNNLDKIEIYLKPQEFNIINKFMYLNAIQDYDKFKHIKVKLNKSNELKLTISGKVTANSTSLGVITSKNIPDILEILQKRVGIEITEATFLNAHLVSIDVTSDKIFKKELRLIISRIRELASLNTSKSFITSYYNLIGFNNSIVIRPTSKTVKDTLTIYNKFEELYSKRKHDNGFFNSLEPEFLEKTKQILRFERRISGKRNLVQALNLDKKSNVNLKAVFSSEIDLIQEKIKKHIKKEKEVF